MKNLEVQKEVKPASEKKSIVKQVTFDQGEWDIVKNAMDLEKITNVSIFIRKSVLLYIGKNIQQKMRL